MNDLDVLEGLLGPRLPSLPRPVQRLAEPEPPPATAPRGPDPALAGTLSILWMGAGQVYAGRRVLGWALMSLPPAALAFHVALVTAWARVAAGAAVLGWSTAVALAGVLSIDALLLVLWAATAVDAYQEASAAGGRPRRLPALATGLASLLVPGWGQLLQGRTRRAGGHLVWGSFQLLALVLLVLAPALVATGSSPRERGMIELALAAAGIGAVALLPLRLTVAHDAASTGAGDRARPLRLRVRLLSYLLVVCGLLAQQQLPAGYYERVVLKASLDARQAGLTLIPDAAQAWVQ